MAAGVTLVDPLAPNVPTPAIVTEFALVVVQFSVVEFPGVMVLGCALNVMVGAAGFEPPPLTVTTAVVLAVPPGPVAVAVYVVVELGLTCTEPEAAWAPNPEIVTEVALLAFQLKVVLEPLLMLVGCAVRTMVGFCELWVETPHPAVAMKKDKSMTVE